MVIAQHKAHQLWKNTHTNLKRAKCKLIILKFFFKNQRCKNNCKLKDLITSSPVLCPVRDACSLQEKIRDDSTSKVEYLKHFVDDIQLKKKGYRVSITTKNKNNTPKEGETECCVGSWISLLVVT